MVQKFFPGDDLQASHSPSAESLYEEYDISPMLRRQIHNFSAQNLEPAPAQNLESSFFSSKSRAELFPSPNL